VSRQVTKQIVFHEDDENKTEEGDDSDKE